VSVRDGSNAGAIFGIFCGDCIAVHVVEYGVPSPKKKAVHTVLTRPSASRKAN
jgi:hypothetical protein